ncbi:hypothetical protein [Micromonospora sp. CV4]|uniref:hypothetical protein n=1 Tax=Micromonospora sp. CV4 TaxID=2478711 RepID=UPI000EF53141|nr:hypothetical protein [Micromonospora sp. CV4]RLP93195.1 hypothetical protein EAD98_19595 [Micromonospora sp. CV4]
MTDPNQQPPQTPYQPSAPVHPPQQYLPAEQDPALGYPGQQPPAPPPAASSKPLLFAVGGFLAVLALLAGGYAVYDGFIKEDSGVAACKAMRDGKEIDGTARGSGDDKPTEAEYRKVREQFEDSRHEKIREHGTALIDIAWQVSNLPEEQEMGALAFMGPLTTHMSGLQTACADQGVIVDLNRGR